MKGLPLGSLERAQRFDLQVTHGRVLVPHMGTLIVPSARGARRMARRTREKHWGDPPQLLVGPLVVLVPILALP